MINIAEIYVSIACICHKLIESIIYVNDTQNSMLYFHKEITIVTK